MDWAAAWSVARVGSGAVSEGTLLENDGGEGEKEDWLLWGWKERCGEAMVGGGMGGVEWVRRRWAGGRRESVGGAQGDQDGCGCDARRPGTAKPGLKLMPGRC